MSEDCHDSTNMPAQRTPQSPFQEPEYLRSRIVIPYDYETSVLAEQQDEARARYLFALGYIRRERARQMVRMGLRAFLFCAVGFALLYIGASL